MNDERTWLLLSLQLSGEASPEEIAERSSAEVYITTVDVVVA